MPVQRVSRKAAFSRRFFPFSLHPGDPASFAMDSHHSHTGGNRDACHHHHSMPEKARPATGFENRRRNRHSARRAAFLAGRPGRMRRISSCSITRYNEGQPVEGFLCRISGHVPWPAPGRKSAPRHKNQATSGCACRQGNDAMTDERGNRFSSRCGLRHLAPAIRWIMAWTASKQTETGSLRFSVIREDA